MKKRTAFSILEMSIIIAIIGLLIAGIVVKKGDLISKARINKIISATQNAPMKDMNDLVIWIEAGTTESFKNSEFIENSAISSWKNIASDTYGTMDFTQSASGLKPLYKIDGIDGLPYVYFDGVDDSIGTASVYGYQLARNNQITVFIVQKYYPGVGAHSFLWQPSSGSNRINGHLKWSDSMIYWDFANISSGGRINAAAPSDFDNQWKIITLYRGTAASFNAVVRINGSVFLTGNMTSNLNLTETGPLTLASGAKLGIREFIIFKRELTAQEIKDIEKYLSKKWSINLI